jgi:iron(III) transport system substrate-binding protein
MSNGRMCGVFAVVAATVSCALIGCGSKSGMEQGGEVILYSSADDYVLREVVAAFEAETGIEVRVVGDTEATKGLALMQRLLDEKDRPRADVWWSSEAFLTIRLSNEGILDGYRSPSIGADWPDRLIGPRWTGFAQRARVIAYNTDKVSADDAPATLRELTDPVWKGRIGMARPQFGTTRGHLGALVVKWGPDGVERWLRAMEANNVRLYDGNASALRGVAQGEVDVCLTDTDDVWSGQRNDWPVAHVYEADEAATGDPPDDMPSLGPLVIPNTVALVRGGPNPDNGRTLIDFLLSETAERILFESDSHNVPVRPALAATKPEYAVPHPMEIDLADVADAMPEAIEKANEILGL